MSRKTIPFTSAGIGKAPIDKPAIYEIETAGGKSNYIGVAKRGRLQERLGEHRPGGPDPVPGAKVRIQQTSSIQEAERAEKKLIARTQPKYNKNHK